MFAATVLLAPASAAWATTASGGPDIATGATESALVAAYASSRGIAAADVAGVVSGSLQTATVSGTEWATASFAPAAADSAAVQQSFQDGAGIGVFTSTDGGSSWTLSQYGGQPLGCPGALPSAVQQAMGLTDPGGCSAAAPASASPSAATPAAVSPSTIVSLANSNVGVGDNPASTNFGADCNPFTTLVGNPDGASSSGCGTDSRYNVRDTNEEWCADFTKYIWEKGGVTADLGTLTPGAASFYTWGKAQGESMPTDSGSPVAGDAVVFYPSGSAPNGSFADHVGIVVAVNSNGTVNLVNGDFSGSSNITVQANDNVSLKSWAAAVWGSGEQWIFVSPGKAAPAPQGGSRASSQSASQADGTVDLFYRNASGFLEHQFFTAKGGWSKPAQMGSEGVVGEPSVTTSSPGTVDVFWQGANGDLWHQFYTPKGGWSSQQDMTADGRLGGPPEAVAQVNGTVDVFWKGTGTTPSIWHAWYNAGKAWAGPQNLGGAAASDPSPVTSSPGVVDVFFEGTNGSLWHVFYLPGSGWHAAADLGMGPLGGAPRATGQLNGTVDVFWQGTGTSPGIWHAWYNPGKAWAGPQNLGGSSASAPMPITSSAGVVDVFFEGSNGALWHTFYLPGSGWHAPASLGMGPLGGGPFGSGEPSGTIDVFWKGSGTSPALWHAWYNAGKPWAGPQSMGGSVA